MNEIGEKKRARIAPEARSRRPSTVDTWDFWAVTVMITILQLAACTMAREGSTVVRIVTQGTNATPVIVNAAANGATAQAADNGATPQATSRGALAFASRWWVWVLVGVGVVVAGWLAWKFIFTGARIALIP